MQPTKLANPLHRLRELDFLRGMAIVLTILRHIHLYDWTWCMGWIGVDLFFVLSGFLVSGLLFREYLKFGNIDIRNFLIRRGFKIYPVYYLFTIVYVVWIIKFGKLNIAWLIPDLLFIQNYVHAWGYTFAGSWSLDVEEHFYFGLAFVAWYIVTRHKSVLTDFTDNKVSKIEKYIGAIMVLCLILRIIQSLSFPYNGRNHTATHVRIDSLLCGVLISYLYYFRFDYLKRFFEKTRAFYFPVIVLLLSFTPFIEISKSIFVTTIGFTMVFIAFGLLILYFLMADDINVRLNKIFSSYVVAFISKVGVYSYSIYIIHTLIINSFGMLRGQYPLLQNKYVFLLVVSAVSFGLGKLSTDFIEDYFLSLRDKYYPKRV